jgi:hypothetical protein
MDLIMTEQGMTLRFSGLSKAGRNYMGWTGHTAISGTIALDSNGRFDVPIAWTEKIEWDAPPPTGTPIIPPTPAPIPARLQGRLISDTLQIQIFERGFADFTSTLHLRP